MLELYVKLCRFFGADLLLTVLVLKIVGKVNVELMINRRLKYMVTKQMCGFF